MLRGDVTKTVCNDYEFQNVLILHYRNISIKSQNSLRKVVILSNDVYRFLVVPER